MKASEATASAASAAARAIRRAASQFSRKGLPVEFCEKKNFRRQCGASLLSRAHAGSVSLHAHIPGDIASFTTQHGAEGAVLTTTSQCDFRSLVYL